MPEKRGFEAIKYALRQSKDGTVVSFVIHPNDLDPALQCLPIGARVMIGWAEILDDERQIGGGGLAPSHPGETRPDREAVPAAAPEPKPKRDRSLSELCAIACADARFQEFIDAKRRKATDGSVTEAVRRICAITSRSHLNVDHPNFNPEAARKWIALHQEFRNYVADLEYGEARQ